MITQSRLSLQLVSVILLTLLASTLACYAAPPPLVSILATDPEGAEANTDPASFTVLRSGPIGNPLTVFYQIGGSAQNGTDYQRLYGTVVIPANCSCAPINIHPLDDLLVESTETVVIGLVQPVTWPPPYFVTWPSAAIIAIADDDHPPTNHPPRVAIVSPPDGSVFEAPADISLVARAWDLDGKVVTVEFFDSNTSLGIVTNRPLILIPIPFPDSDLELESERVPELFPDVEVDLSRLSTDEIISRIPGSLFRLKWPDVPPGEHVVTAVATDHRGASTRSEAVHIKVTEAPAQPVVNVIARDPMAAEPGPWSSRLNTATFQISRSGNTNLALEVFYRVSGSASNGVDYEEIRSVLTIPAGARAAEVQVRPLDDTLVEGPEHVVITIVPPVCIAIHPPPPDCYLVGRHSRARAVIFDNDRDPTNRPPVVRIVRPEDGDTFRAPANVTIVAQAKDYDGDVEQVEFFEGTNSLGIVRGDSNVPTASRPSFSLTWSNVPPGHYVLSAEATDNAGATTLSPPVEIKVTDRTLPPVVSIVTTDAEAAEGFSNEPRELSGTPIVNTARFSVRRTGSTDRPLEVHYRLTGSADNGVDYRELPGHVTIPVGAAAADVVIIPIDDSLCEGAEKVVATLIPWPCLSTSAHAYGCYVVGRTNEAGAVIRDNDVCPSNQPPKVAIVRPESGQIFRAPADIAIYAEARDPDGTVVVVEFFADGRSLGRVPNDSNGDSLFVLKWQDVPAGSYHLTATATDNRGASSTSDPVRIRVIEIFELPIVTIEASDPHASEGGIQIGPKNSDGPVFEDSAVFTLKRSGPTNSALQVHYSVGGMAENGVDYVRLSGLVIIPAGLRAARLEVAPIDDRLVENTESVVVELEPVACPRVIPPPPGCYLVGDPARAVAYIRDNDAQPNRPPKVDLTSPPDGAVFEAPADIRLVAVANDSDGWVETVEFFAGSTSLGIVTNHPWLLDPVKLEASQVRPFPIWNPFHLLWSNVPPGEYRLSALATDNQGAATRSDSIAIKVTPASEQPIVSVSTSDPEASEGERSDDTARDTATFKIARRGPTTLPLEVFYRLSGSASNGVDYRELPHSVTIPEGASATEVVIVPIDDNLVEGTEKVILTIVPPACIAIFPPPPDCYLVGRNHSARAAILDNDGDPNVPPRVHIVRPADGETFRAGADIQIVAEASDADGSVASVEFFEGTNSLGVVTHPIISLEPIPLPAGGDLFVDSIDPILIDAIMIDPRIPRSPRYTLTWSNVPPGHYVLAAVATDNRGATGISRPVEIKVAETNPPPIVTVETIRAETREMDPRSLAPLIPGVFEVRRTGPTTTALTVHYRLGGTADNGVDYERLPGFVTIPIGASSEQIFVVAIDDAKCEGTESVLLSLVPSPCLTVFPPPRDCYRVGEPSFGRVAILDNDICPSNQPPRVVIVRPEDGAIFEAPAEIVIYADARDADGKVASVEFFANNLSLGVVRNSSSNADHLFRLAWHSVPAGGYVLTAVATDNDGASSRSDPVRIKVIESPRQPMVSIVATDPLASEGGIRIGPPEGYGPIRLDPAVFTVERSGPTNVALRVFYAVSGTASNGLDYDRLTGEVLIPAGSRSARIVVDPVDDNLTEGTETVVAALRSPVCAAVMPPPPGCYLIGPNRSATAYIRDNDTQPNLPPRVAIVRPNSGAMFDAFADIEIVVHALDPDGWVPTVEFFAGDRKIGEQTIYFIVAPPPGQLQVFSMIWSNVPPGQYALTARATDDQGRMNVSDPVHITVDDPNPRPVVTIMAPDTYAREDGNQASFRVRRTGNTDEPLSVRYAISGSAINGADYQTLSGIVTIGPGRRSARVTLVPVDDRQPEPIETVILQLVLPPPAGGAPYVIGQPEAAAAIIVDNDQPRPPCRRLADGSFHVCLPGSSGFSYRLEMSHDLVNWEPVETNTVTDGAIHFVDRAAGVDRARFYRAVPADDLQLKEE